MCGITLVAALGQTLSGRHQGLLQNLNRQMINRGPDGEGFWTNGSASIAMAHRRLAVQDLSPNGQQPLHFGDGRYTIVFNGEVYNFRALREELESLGHKFVSNTDTEVIVAAYAQYGRECVQRLRGMFAFAIFDAAANTLFLARDPFGIKPLYWRVTQLDGNNQLWVCSQVKPLTTLPATLTADPAGEAGFLLWGHIPEPYSLHKEIRALPAGHYALIPLNNANKLTHTSHLASTAYIDIAEDLANIAENAPAKQYSEAECHFALTEALNDTVRQHMVADVPVGVFLSAGLDSTTIAALAREHTEQLHTLTIGIDEYRGSINDEVPMASMVAGYLQTEHRSIWIGKEDFEKERAALLQAMDQPTIDGINVYMVCRAAKQTGLKVALSGLGGDELFGSYPSFNSIPKWVHKTRTFSPLGKSLRTMTAPWIGKFTSPKAAGMFEYGHTYEGAYLLRRGLYMPWELEARLGETLAREGLEELDTLARLQNTHKRFKDSRLKVSLLEALWYMRHQLLRDADWASMAHSVELRVPFVDLELWRQLVPYLNESWALRKTDIASVAKIKLPTAIVEKRKTGFTVPVKQWVTGLAESEGEKGAREWANQIIS